MFKWHERQSVGYIYHRDIDAARNCANQDRESIMQGVKTLLQDRYKAVQAGQVAGAGIP